MRALFWVVALFALATTLDTSLNNGVYTQAVSRMVSDMVVHFQ